MNWADVLQDKSLQDLPYKIETNEYGQIVMSPASNRHGVLQGRIIGKLTAQMTEGEVITECAVQTARGVKVTDVSWASGKFMNSRGDKAVYEVAPELCVEVLSPSNSVLEIDDKISLYFAQGALEVWICNDRGQMRFIGAGGDIPRSVLYPEFPQVV